MSAGVMPEVLAPMLAGAGPLPSGPGWAFEVKWDGVRVTGYLDGSIRLRARSGTDITMRYPELQSMPEALAGRRAVLDGEIIASQEGRIRLEALQPRIHLANVGVIAAKARLAPVDMMVFDLLWLDGTSLLDQPYQRRRRLLEQLGLASAHIHVPPAFGRAEHAAAFVREYGLEGVVAKRLDSPYRPGRRTDEWIKWKPRRLIDATIGGWIASEDGHGLSSVLVGLPDDDGLRFAGAVGSGLSDAERHRLPQQLTGIARSTAPFTSNFTAADYRDRRKLIRWCEPTLVAGVEYSDRTSRGIFLHPVWKGLR